jgi:hypothetical protein
MTDLPPLVVTWVTVEDVAAELGIATTSDSDAWLERSTDAANSWAYRRRLAAGYLDVPDAAPDDAAFAGTVLYAATLYQSRGAIDGHASFDAFGGAVVAPTGGLGRVYQLLGINRPVIA